MPLPLTIGIVLFEGFELLDVFGPCEAYGSNHLDGTFKLLTVAAQAGAIASAQGPAAIADYSFNTAPHLDMLLVPGGIGTRREVGNPTLLAWLRARSTDATIVTSVCTGAALLARTGLLDGLRATTNKRAFAWVTSQGPAVNWIRQARWVEDGKFATSSGVSAGIDMALALISRLVSAEVASTVAIAMEYEWHRDPAGSLRENPRPRMTPQ
ncbi:MAG TPA: DJ-1/PfpI family protein [Candidatus Binataceae bacterium]|nr:DJ-1/PfpI family protein [Candidatus Binataceae bacterium]